MQRKAWTLAVGREEFLGLFDARGRARPSQWIRDETESETSPAASKIAEAWHFWWSVTGCENCRSVINCVWRTAPLAECTEFRELENAFL